MNENVTIKIPKRRRWIARLLVSALCILLASSLLFVSVVAENVNTFSAVQIDETDFSEKTMYGLFYGDDGRYGLSELVYSSEGFKFNAYSYEYETEYHSPLFQCTYMPLTDVWTATVGWTFDLLNFASNKTFFWVYYHCYFAAGTIGNASYIDCIVADCFSWSGYKVDSVVYDSNGNETYTNIRNMSFMEPFCYFDLDGYAFSMGLYANDSDKYLIYENGNIHTVNEVYAYLMWDDGWFAVSQNTNDHVLDLEYFTFANASQGAVVSFGFATFCHFSGSVLSYYRKFFTTVTAKTLTLSDGVVSAANSIYPYNIDLARTFVYMTDPYSDGYYESIVGKGWYTVGFASARPTIKDAFIIYDIYATSSEYVPPESSDETTTDPPPESSEESSVVGVIDLYSYDKLSDGTYESAFIGTLDLTDATGLRVFLGMYLLGDNVWSDIKTPLTLLVYREDGSLDTYTYDYYAAGFAWGGGSPGSFTFPKFIGGYFDIPLSSSSELYFASSAPGGTIWLQNNSVVLRQINLLNSDSYVELENVSAEECIISVYDSPLDEDPESYVYTSGVLKYTLRKRNSSSSIPVSLDYGETGIVHGVMKYNGADFTVSSIILASDPDLMPPIYDFESMDNALSEAYDDVSRQQYLENLLTSYIENAYGTVSYDPDTSGAFLGGVDLMGDIVDSSGGSIIISAFVNMWSIHPFFPAMVGLLGTFLIFSFFLRKA